MDISIDRTLPVGIKEQIKKQILTHIGLGRIQPGEKLLAAADLARQLKINRNTAALVYKELEQDGVVSIVKGSGTYVNDTPVHNQQIRLKTIFDHAYQTAVQSGFDHDEIMDLFISGLLEKSNQKPRIGKAILIDCNYPVLETLDQKIKQECVIESHLMLIQDILTLPGKFIKRANAYDHIICGMNHLDELKQAAPAIAENALSFVIKTDFAHLHHIMSLPPETAVGYCCLSPKSAHAFFSNQISNRTWQFPPIFAGLSDTASIETMIAGCDIIFATHYIYDALIQEHTINAMVHKVDLEIDPASFDFIISNIKKEHMVHG